MSELPHFIAIIGREGSGKDSYGNYLAQRGYMHVSAGDVMRSRARELGYTDPIPRSVLSKVGDEMKREFGSSPITEMTIAAYGLQKAKYPEGLVISGLRRVGELKSYKNHGAVLLWINADDERRFANQNHRSRTDQQDLKSFLERSNLEYYGSTDGGEDGVNLQAVEAMADCRVENNSTLEDLFSRATQALNNIA